ncbi:MAG: hypothetical protein DMF77_18745 [Acidobacteria bacterium]|nr:MAG: hypothetical protein DMF77_18745 [Acidobacteriota bacterium]
MISFALALALAGAGSAPSSTEAGSSPHFAITAQFRPGRTAGTGEVAVTFAPKDPDVKINVEKVAPKRAGAPDEKYLDLTFPVVFPVSVLGSVPAAQTVKGLLTYYYCSHREGWCRKGTADLEIPVKAH